MKVLSMIEEGADDNHGDLFRLIERVGDLFYRFSFDAALVYESARVLREKTVAENQLHDAFDMNYEDVVVQCIPNHECTIAEYDILEGMLSDPAITPRSVKSVKAAMVDFWRHNLVPTTRRIVPRIFR